MEMSLAAGIFLEHTNQYRSVTNCLQRSIPVNSFMQDKRWKAWNIGGYSSLKLTRSECRHSSNVHLLPLIRTVTVETTQSFVLFNEEVSCSSGALLIHNNLP
jgi:hypothetical protein